MSFTPPIFRRITPEESSPVGNFMSHALDQYNKGINSAYLPKNLEAAIKKAQLFNQYYGPNIESQMGLRGAQTGLANAQTGLAGAHAGLYNSQTNQGNLIQNLLRQELGFGNDSSVNDSNTNVNTARGNPSTEMDVKDYPNEWNPRSSASQTPQGHMTPHGFEGGIGQENPQNLYSNTGAVSDAVRDQILSNRENQQQPNYNTANSYNEGNPQSQQQVAPERINNKKDLLKNMLLSSALKVKPQVIDVNGTKYMYGANGLTEIAKGLNPTDLKLAEMDAKKISDLESSVVNSAPTLDLMGQLNGLISNPSFENMRQNPLLKQHELGWFSVNGTPEQQNLAGQFATLSGDIIKAGARDFKGAFRTGEQGLLNSMKANPSDSLDVMKGKMEALTLMTKMLYERSGLEAKFMREQHMKPVDAVKSADLVINVKKIKSEIHNKLNPPKFNDLEAEFKKRKLQ